MDYRILDIANQTIVKAIKDEAVHKNMPQRYIDNIHSEFDGELWIWIDFKGKHGQPLDLFFEEGTKDHKITPTKKKALSFIEKGAIGIVTGLRWFSKGHWVSGIEARYIFRDGLRAGYPRFKKRLVQELQKEFQENMLFG